MELLYSEGRGYVAQETAGREDAQGPRTGIVPSSLSLSLCFSFPPSFLPILFSPSINVCFRFSSLFPPLSPLLFPLPPLFPYLLHPSAGDGATATGEIDQSTGTVNSEWGGGGGEGGGGEGGEMEEGLY